MFGFIKKKFMIHVKLRFFSSLCMMNHIRQAIRTAHITNFCSKQTIFLFNFFFFKFLQYNIRVLYNFFFYLFAIIGNLLILSNYSYRSHKSEVFLSPIVYHQIIEFDYLVGISIKIALHTKATLIIIDRKKEDVKLACHRSNQFEFNITSAL